MPIPVKEVALKQASRQATKSSIIDLGKGFELSYLNITQCSGWHLTSTRPQNTPEATKASLYPIILYYFDIDWKWFTPWKFSCRI